MSTSEKRAALAHLREELTAEHESVRSLVDRLRQPHAVPEVKFPVLDELHATLKTHFAHEEYPGGFYEAMGACTAEHAEDLRVLVDQHYLILSAVNSLRERAHAASTPNDAFDRELRALVDLIAGHERHEHQLAHALAG